MKRVKIVLSWCCAQSKFLRKTKEFFYEFQNQRSRIFNQWRKIVG